jgi:diguanylate cyclase (GGDEF)-like protein
MSRPRITPMANAPHSLATEAPPAASEIPPPAHTGGPDAERVRPAAGCDALTGRLTRQAFLTDLQRRLAVAPELPAALLVVDLDRFHRINAEFGSAVGDSVLRSAAKRMLAVYAAPQCLARLGADEFALCIFGAPRVDRAELLAERLLAAFDPPMLIGGHEISVSAAIGVARRDECDADTLLAWADHAMRDAKLEGRRSFCVRAPKGERFGAPCFDDQDLKSAIAGNQLSLAFQPIFDAKTGKMRSAEALVRWAHHTLGPIAPTDFVPAAERSGLIIELGWWVLESAVDKLARHEDLRLAVNVSPLQFRRHGFALQVQELLHSHKVPATQLEIEITENTLIDKSDVAERTLRQLRDVGVAVALDDFGSGFSSLGYLQRLAVDKLKLDQSFARGLADRADTSRLVRSIIDLGHSLGLTVVAEGVETQLQAGLLQLLGCDLLQGYALGVPLNEAEFTAKYLAAADKSPPGPSIRRARD